MVSGTSVGLKLWDFPLEYCRCRQIMSLVAVHRQALPACAWFDHWCGVWSTDDHNWQQAYQASNLGHSMCSKWTLTHRNCLPQCMFFYLYGCSAWRRCDEWGVWLQFWQVHNSEVMISWTLFVQVSWQGPERIAFRMRSLCGIERCIWWAVLSCWVQGSDDLITDDSLLQIWTGWARVISVYHQIVLQRSGWCIAGIWHHQVQFHTGSLYFIVSMVASCFWGQIVGTITYEK
jgi:hypothetical protein